MAEGKTPYSVQANANAEQSDATFAHTAQAFVATMHAPDYARRMRSSPDQVIQTLGTALSPAALARATFRSDLLKALRQVSRGVDQLTHSTARNEFETYLTLAAHRRLRELLRALLYSESPLAQRIDAFKQAVDEDYAELLPARKQAGRKHIGLGLISLLLTASQPQRYSLYRQSLLQHARSAWRLKDVLPDTPGERYTAYLDWLAALRERSGEVMGQPVDWIDLLALLKFERGARRGTQRNNDASAAPAPAPTLTFAPAAAVAPIAPLLQLRDDASMDADADRVYLSEPLAGLRRAAAHTRNIILYGPPGVGKTYWAGRFAHVLTDAACIETVTLHPSFAYEEFVEGLRPVAGESGTLSYRVTEGVFRRLCRRAEADPARRYVLVIDEINRAHIARTFGDLITLIEDDKRLGQPNELRLTLPYSQQALGVPANLYLLGTMNTADRSIALLDLALRRRFAFVELLPDPSVLGEVSGVNLAALLAQLNPRIVALLDRDHQVGHAYLLGVNDTAGLHFAWYQRIVPLLQEYFYNDGERLNAALGSDFVRPVSASESSTTGTQGAWDRFAASDVTHYEIVRLQGDAFLAALRGLSGQDQT